MSEPIDAEFTGADIRADIIFTTRELHLVGDMVAVCWSTREIERELIGPDGLVYKAKAQERHPGVLGQEKPYIDFVTIRRDGRSFYENEDKPTAGGFGVQTALQLVSELQRAIEYIKHHQ